VPPSNNIQLTRLHKCTQQNEDAHVKLLQVTLFPNSCGHAYLNDGNKESQICNDTSW